MGAPLTYDTEGFALGTNLAERRVAHPKAGANMLGEQFDSAPIGDGVGLRQVPHGFYQKTLAIDITGIGGSLAPLASYAGWNRDRKNLGHAILVSRVDF